MKKVSIIILFIFSAVTATAQKEKNKPPYSAKDKTVEVYTTADSTELKLSANGEASFKDMPQPFENQVCVFIDPAKTFQNYLGIGAALTDASAETFYKMPKTKQQELLKAYFDKKDGIGYTVARTNINSCDFSRYVHICK